MSFFENTRKPQGFGGKIMVAMMNSGHCAMADWGFRHTTIAEDDCILEAGCVFTYKVFPNVGHGGLITEQTEQFIEEVKATYHASLKKQR